MRRRDTRLGILGFLLITLAVLAAVVVFARYPALFRRGREYRAEFRSVAGLNPGDEVRFGGVLVGTVTAIALSPDDPTRILVRFRVRGRTPMRRDTEASIGQVGFLGQPHLSLRAGSRTSPELAEGGRVRTVESPTFTDAVARLAQFLDRVDTLLTGAERVVRVSPLERLDRTLARIDTLVATGAAGSERVFAQLDAATARLTTLLERSDRLVTSIDTVVRGAGTGLSDTQREALLAARDLRLVIGDLRDALAQDGGVDQLVRNMVVASEKLARLAERLDRDPAAILRQRAAPVKQAGPAVRR